MHYGICANRLLQSLPVSHLWIFHNAPWLRGAICGMHTCVSLTQYAILIIGTFMVMSAYALQSPFIDRHVNKL